MLVETFLCKRLVMAMVCVDKTPWLLVEHVARLVQVCQSLLKVMVARSSSVVPSSGNGKGFFP